MIPEIKIKEYDYPLPDDRIAKYPLARRDDSKLLSYKDGQIEEHSFRELASLLPQNSLMVFNDTKVVPARMHFRKDTGAIIEIFCLEPVLPAEYATMFSVTDRCRWKCIIGNVKRWKGGALVPYNPDNSPEVSALGLEAVLVERSDETAVVEFTWTDSSAFSRVLEVCGSIPIPPYLNRDTEETDKERYQTLYAKYRGSVAAPTAGLHFTPEVLQSISDKGIETAEVCLHVGAGTFLPVKSAEISGHRMHREPFAVSLALIEKLRDIGSRKVIAVGTTSVRTLESLYYAGVQCLENGHPYDIPQWMPYCGEYAYSASEAYDALASYMKKNSLSELKLGTSIIIVPGYRFKAVDVLVTNFHQPQSTLLLLISAFLSGDWRRPYDFALSHNFRFLSYGDSSVLFRAQQE